MKTKQSPIPFRAAFITLPLLTFPLWQSRGAFAQENGSSSGPSFNCAKAASTAEHAVCASPLLSADDLEMAHRYIAASTLSNGLEHDNLVAQQRAWASSRENCKPSVPNAPANQIVQCLDAAYKQRIGELGLEIAKLTSGSRAVPAAVPAPAMPPTIGHSESVASQQSPVETVANSDTPRTSSPASGDAPAAKSVTDAQQATLTPDQILHQLSCDAMVSGMQMGSLSGQGAWHPGNPPSAPYGIPFEQWGDYEFSLLLRKARDCGDPVITFKDGAMGGRQSISSYVKTQQFVQGANISRAQMVMQQTQRSKEYIEKRLTDAEQETDLQKRVNILHSITYNGLAGRDLEEMRRKVAIATDAAEDGFEKQETDQKLAAAQARVAEEQRSAQAAEAEAQNAKADQEAQEAEKQRQAQRSQQHAQEMAQQQQKLADLAQQEATLNSQRQARQQAQQNQDEARQKQVVQQALQGAASKVDALGLPNGFENAAMMGRNPGGWQAGPKFKEWLELMFASGLFTDIHAISAFDGTKHGVSMKRPNAPSTALIFNLDGDELYLYADGESGDVHVLSEDEQATETMGLATLMVSVMQKLVQTSSIQ